MDITQLEGLAGGRLYTGKMAKQVKLVDELGTLDQAVDEAKRLAGLKDDEKVERLYLPKPKSFLEQLMGGSLTESETQSLAARSLASLAPDLMQHVEHAQMLRRLFAEPAVLVMPYSVEVR
jgi:protease IV